MCISLWSFYHLELAVGTNNRDVKPETYCSSQTSRPAVQSRHDVSTPRCQSRSLLLLLLCCGDLCSQGLTSPASLLEPQPSRPVFQPPEETRDKVKGDEGHLAAVFLGRFLLIGQRLGTWPHPDGRLGRVFILDDCVASPNSRVLLLWKKARWVLQNS